MYIAPEGHYNVPDAKQKRGNHIRRHKGLCFGEQSNEQAAKNALLHPHIDNIEQHAQRKENEACIFHLGTRQRKAADLYFKMRRTALHL